MTSRLCIPREWCCNTWSADLRTNEACKVISCMFEEEEEKEGWKSEPPTTFLSALEGTDTVRKRQIKFDVSANRMAALCSIQTGCPDFCRKEAPTSSGHHSYRTWHCQDGTNKLWQNMGKKTAKICCLKNQKCEDLVYKAAEASYLTKSSWASWLLKVRQVHWLRKLGTYQQ